MRAVKTFAILAVLFSPVLVAAQSPKAPPQAPKVPAQAPKAPVKVLATGGTKLNQILKDTQPVPVLKPKTGVVDGVKQLDLIPGTQRPVVRPFIRRIRGGDEQAATDLVRRYESLIRREVRLRLEDRGLNRLFDSADVCQSVLASFFVRAAAGQYDLERPDQLVRLLVTMARNKLVSSARKHRRQCRDHRRAGAGTADFLDEIAQNAPTPGEIVAGRDLLEGVRRELSAEERHLADLRAEGRTWHEVAEQLGGTAQARRVQLGRALDRAARALGLEEEVCHV